MALLLRYYNNGFVTGSSYNNVIYVNIYHIYLYINILITTPYPEVNGVNLPSSLQYSSFKGLSILYQTTCVGLKYDLVLS